MGYDLKKTENIKVCHIDIFPELNINLQTKKYPIYTQNRPQNRNKINYTLEFVPGRIVITDARIEHRVNPLTPASKDFRFTLALKCADSCKPAVKNLSPLTYVSLDNVRLI
jgi:hypothetical protein